MMGSSLSVIRLMGLAQTGVDEIETKSKIEQERAPVQQARAQNSSNRSRRKRRAKKQQKTSSGASSSSSSSSSSIIIDRIAGAGDDPASASGSRDILTCREEPPKQQREQADADAKAHAQAGNLLLANDARICSDESTVYSSTDKPVVDNKRTRGPRAQANSSSRPAATAAAAASEQKIMPAAIKSQDVSNKMISTTTTTGRRKQQIYYNQHIKSKFLLSTPNINKITPIPGNRLVNDAAIGENAPAAATGETITTFRQHQQQQQDGLQNSTFDPCAYYPAPPPPRPWIDRQPNSNKQKFNRNSKTTLMSSNNNNNEFTVLSYNVLCDRMVNSVMFPNSPDIALDWSYRRPLILKQLLDFDADIIALQELEMEQFETYFKPKLETLAHYESLFEPKSRAKTMDLHKRRRVDGCAIFYKRNKFKLVQMHLLEFNQMAMANACGSEAMLNRVMTKDNIGLAAILELKPQHKDNCLYNKRSQKQETTTTTAKKQHILVCNTHIHWDPEHCDVKLIQTIMLMNELECIARHHQNELNQLTTNQLLTPLSGVNETRYYQTGSGNSDELIPLILLGDFNSLPNSGVTNYITKGNITSMHKDFKNYRYTSCTNSLAVNSNSINQLRRQSSPAWYYYSSGTKKSDINSRITLNYSSSINESNSISSLSSSPSSSTSTLTTTSDLSSADSGLSTGFQSSGSISPTISNSVAKTSSSSFKDIMLPALDYSHPFRLTSAYEKGIMPYTNYTAKFKAIIDYIFYSNESLQLQGLLGPLDNDWLRNNRIKGFPQPYLPSDHLPLLVKFKLSVGVSDVKGVTNRSNEIGFDQPLYRSNQPQYPIQNQHNSFQSKNQHMIMMSQNATASIDNHQQDYQGALERRHSNWPAVASMGYNGMLFVGRPCKRQVKDGNKDNNINNRSLDTNAFQRSSQHLPSQLKLEQTSS